MTAAGWYPNPSGSGGVRFWDGLQWTNHLAHLPPAPLPQAPPPPAPPPPAPLRVFIDESIGSGIHAKRLVVDENGFHLNQRSMLFDAIDSVGYQSVQTKMYGVLSTTKSFEFRFTAGAERLKFSFVADNLSRKRMDSKQDLYTDLIAICQRHVEQRLAGTICNYVRNGGTVDIDSVTIGPNGISGRSPLVRKSRTYPWSALHACWIERAAVHVEAVDNGRISEVITLDLIRPNAPLVPTIVEDVVRTIRNAPPRR